MSHLGLVETSVPAQVDTDDGGYKITDSHPVTTVRYYTEVESNTRLPFVPGRPGPETGTGVLLVTMFVVSKKGKLFPPPRTCLTYSTISKIFNLTIHHLWGRVLTKHKS